MLSDRCWPCLSFWFTAGYQLERPVPAEDAAKMDALYDQSDACIEQRMGRLHVPGAALAMDEGDKIVYLRGFSQSPT